MPQHVGWRPGEALREGWLTVAHGRWAVAVMLLAVVWVLALPAAIDAATVSRIAEREQEWLRAGGLLYSVSMPQGQEGGIPAVACDRLNLIDGVVAAAPVTRQNQPVRFASMPGRDFTLLATTDALWRVVGAQPQPGGLLVAEAGAETLGVGTGSSVRLGSRPVGLAGVGAPAAQAVPGGVLVVEVADLAVLGDEYALVIGLPGLPRGEADTCFALADAARHASLGAVLPGLLARDGVEPIASERLFSGQFGPDFPGDLRERTLRWAALPASLLLALLWSLVQWTRRPQDALYATVGLDRQGRLLLRGAEWMCVAVFGGLWGVALAVVGAAALGAEPRLALEVASRHAGATLAVTTAFLVIGLVVRPPGVLASLKDR